MREPARGVDEVDAGRLARERHGARGARVRLEDVDGRVGDRELDVEQADDAERRPEPLDDVLHLERVRERQRLRGQHAGRVAGVDAGLLDVLHHGADEDLLAVAERVDVDLDRVLDEAVDEHRPADRRHRGAQVVLVVADAHRAAAEHVRRPDEHRVADLARRGERLVSAPSTVDHGGQRTPSSRRARRTARDPRRGRSPRAACRGSGSRPPRCAGRAGAASGRRTA